MKNHTFYVTQCRALSLIIGQRVGLFDGLSQHCADDSTTETYQSTENSSTEPSQTLPLLIPAKHVAVISALRSSPPPDLGLPMASADIGTAGDPNGPPVLELESNHVASGHSDAANCKTPTDAETSAAAASLTSAPPADNGVIIID